ncbi:MAG: HD domain-containing protein [Acidaminococcaceae bacterium]|jgi:putative hydrolase of HD superfamily|nr:HD domain-containing protein [Acidaminococcaceae bacterium]
MKKNTAEIVLPKDLLEFMYEAAHIQRWNDHIRPQGFTELDKQAHKMMILYILARYEEQDQGAKLDWQELIEGGIFEFLHRIILTDIKPPIFHELMRQRGPELNKWVYTEMERRIPSLTNTKFMDRMQIYFDKNTHPLEKKLISAAHYLATEWEFRIVYHLNQGIYGVEEIKEAIAEEVEEYSDLAGVQKIALNSKTRKFVDLIGKLRFQERWSQSPRVPETSVMGHVLVVAVLSYLCALSVGACKARLVNDFLGGLWHDLPEVLTRDIISPIKRSVEGLDEIIKEIEQRQLEEQILPLLPTEWHKDIINYTVDEFDNKILVKGERQIVKGDITAQYNKNRFSPVDGKIIRGCDHLAAFMEAWLSIQYGITSIHLANAVKSLPEQYAGKVVGGVNFGKIYAQFVTENS